MAAKGFKERVLVPALRKQGLSVSEAKAAIDAVFGSIKNALLRHESVELPIGSFTLLRNPETQRAWRFGDVKVLYAHKYQVDFLPSDELKLAAAAALSSPPPPKSELTISAELIVDFIRRNVEPDNRRLFFDRLRPSPSINAVFEIAKPKPEERRPLEDAAHVIAECAPERMPRDPRLRLDACIEWFARWTRRVIPTTVWQEAMEQAMKTMVGPA